MSTAIALRSKEINILFWLGPKNPLLNLLSFSTDYWDKIYYYNGRRVYNFKSYMTDYNLIIKKIKKDILNIKLNYQVSEILTSSDEYYLTLIFMKVFGRESLKKLSLMEDGIGLYLSQRKPNFLKYIIKFFIDMLLMRRSLQFSRYRFSGNKTITKIYTVCPHLLPPTQNKIIIDINKEFKEAILLLSNLVHLDVPSLPDGSAVILSQPLHEAKLMSFDEEKLVILAMIRFLNENEKINIKQIYVKLQHNDSEYKREFYSELGMYIINNQDYPYEILHLKLKPNRVLSFSSSALFYCSFFDSPSKFISFCGNNHRFEKIASLFKAQKIFVSNI